MKHAKLEIMACIKRFKDENPNGVFVVSYGLGSLEATSATPWGSANIEFKTHVGDTVIMNADDMVWVLFPQPESTRNQQSGRALCSQDEEVNGEFDMKDYIPSKRNPMAGSLQNAVNRQQVLPDRKRRCIKNPLPEDYEYEH